MGALLPFFGGGLRAPTKTDYRKRGTLILTSLLEDPSDFFVASGTSSLCSLGEWAPTGLLHGVFGQASQYGTFVW